MPEQGTEIAVRQSTDPVKVDMIKAVLRGEMDASELAPAGNSEEAQKRMFEQILNAADDAEMENLGASTPWQELAGVPVMIHGFDAAISDKKEGSGPPIFAVVDVTDMRTDERLTVTNGSWNVWAGLLNLVDRGEIPGAIRVLEIGAETRSGGRPQRLVTTKSEQNARKAAKLKEKL